MNLYDRIKALADTQKISIRRLEENIGFGNGTINRWRKNTPGVDKLSKVADYFKVSTDYLLGRTDDKTSLSPKEMSDIGQLADRMLDGLESENSVNFYGEPMSDEDKASLKAALLVALEMNKKRSKKD
ncbi:helix-turn-helix domain-containing protein [Ligilactobacillus ruminis]|uniref:DNA-binding helix-turn-helix protein n=1 Tax=Ligilactobacillus ruminis ATCC 25644 TaxID=525362 RepID=E7FQT0_9LACO|nr:helix-turn-helix transcriptional regulator [Ligilactobacillus ruminis]EFZ34630.1 DNA-binding helix-turn-helix protein [Ligilactobacillus ruminis ATCC 25644]EGX99343.1 Cro/CI family phage transcriptional regulator [Ligilactobacillus ruminis ATCC 25644]MBT9627840.1 helix-turn-helix domain-containing protein [Ligilactobacillus ruminis]UWP40552.1 helix-turn-helix domain-containing protein [Ligilactobacillus ruminis]